MSEVPKVSFLWPLLYFRLAISPELSKIIIKNIIITFSQCMKFIVLGAKFREHSAKNQHNISCLEFKAEHHITGPGSLEVRAFALGSVGCGFAPRSRHTKAVKNGTSSSLADVRIKRVVLGR